MSPRTQDYFRSLSAELDVQADRVRSLIGNVHWLSDGGHKEALLRGFLGKHLPCGTAIARGFLVNPLSPAQCSREQDVLILDTSVDPPLFNYGGLAVASCEQAFACLSVKTAFGKKEFIDSLKTFLSIPNCTTGRETFFGSYHYAADNDDSLTSLGGRVASWLKPELRRVSMVVRVSPTVFFLLTTNTKPHKLCLYKTTNSSTAFFVARLVNHIASLRSSRASAFADALDASDSCSDVQEVGVP
jgi:hypothetical protein